MFVWVEWVRVFDWLEWVVPWFGLGLGQLYIARLWATRWVRISAVVNSARTHHGTHTSKKYPPKRTHLLEAVDVLLELRVPVEVVGLGEGVDLALLRNPGVVGLGGVAISGGGYL